MSGELFGSTFSPPTPNGDFHLGHFAGPVLSSDVCARALRRRGHEVRFACSTDDNQTYVVTTARRLGEDPNALIAHAFEQTSASLELAGISVTGYTMTDAPYEEFVREFCTGLWRSGAFDLRTVDLPYDVAAQAFLTEAFMTGRCPHCLAHARAGVCEACGLYNLPGQLLDNAEREVEYRSARIWMLDLERHRALISEELLTRHRAGRPSLARIIEKTLAAPLPSIPMTYPIEWGIPVEWDGVPGTINAWPEIFVGHLYWLGLTDPAPGMSELVQFIGIDNGFYNAFVYTALAALARRAGIAEPPARRTITNNYLQLGGRKFSTSKGDVIWARQFLADVGRDRARFVLALKAPDFQHAEFTMESARDTLNERFDTPLRRLAVAFAAVPPRLDARDFPHPEQWWTTALTASTGRFDEAYDLDTFSTKAAAEAFALHIEVLLLGYTTRDMSRIEEQAGAVRFLHALATLADPIVPDIAATVASLFDARLAVSDPVAV
ncbi:class I tRNA ligase family protein [Nocardia sp. CA2R105]|uniref:class I tRNA ligase family protein n=1 Tax=Nocardia coffeae TaxID=2873381 RepID=UPI001CA69C13|nr:class I tRNA ligase family protein [Nocardia coffeae]MBY8863523.1 class I tRNA ligase family protein [Nocardia coffeae]